MSPLTDRLQQQKADIENQLRKIAGKKSDIFHHFRLPKRYGKNSSIKCADTLKMVPQFDPDKAGKLSATWESLLITGEDKNGLDLSETGYKLALTLRLKGEALDYVLTYKEKSLQELMEILESRFEKKLHKADWIQNIKSFNKEKDESMISAIQRLKYYK